MLEFNVKDKVLHIIYDFKKDITREIIEIANSYEGEMNNRIGFNFPMSFVKKIKPKSLLLSYKADYVIVYKKGDIQTKKHELQHVLYALDEIFKCNVVLLWNSFTEDYRKNVIQILLNMNYPNNFEILLDEFQAYYYTEKPNFFGKKYMTHRSKKIKCKNNLYDN
jgi:hypothetical protein